MTKIEREALISVIKVLVGNNDIVRTRKLLDDAIDEHKYELAADYQREIKRIKESIPSPDKLENLKTMLESQEDLENET